MVVIPPAALTDEVDQCDFIVHATKMFAMTTKEARSSYIENIKSTVKFTTFLQLRKYREPGKDDAVRGSTASVTDPQSTVNAPGAAVDAARSVSGQSTQAAVAKPPYDEIIDSTVTSESRPAFAAVAYSPHSAAPQNMGGTRVRTREGESLSSHRRSGGAAAGSTAFDDGVSVGVNASNAIVAPQHRGRISWPDANGSSMSIGRLSTLENDVSKESHRLPEQKAYLAEMDVCVQPECGAAHVELDAAADNIRPASTRTIRRDPAFDVALELESTGNDDVPPVRNVSAAGAVAVNRYIASALLPHQREGVSWMYRRCVCSAAFYYANVDGTPPLPLPPLTPGDASHSSPGSGRNVAAYFSMIWGL